MTEESWSAHALVNGIPLMEYLCQEHNDKDKMAEELEDIADIKPVRGKILENIKKAAPYNVLENTLIFDKDMDQSNQSVSFPELFDESLGELESSILFSKEVDLRWIVFNYCLTKNGDKPLTIAICPKTDCISEQDKILLKHKPNIKIAKYEATEENGHNS